MTVAGAATGAAWVDRFHAGDRQVLESCYRDHFRTVDRAVAQVLRGADRETVVHDVFLQLLDSAALRRSFAGGAFATWLATVARNRAIDYWRHHRRERPLEEAPAESASPESGERLERDVEVRLLVDQFRQELPAKWMGVFEVRFLAALDQRSAARRLGISRTTLAYREMKVRRLLHRFVRRGRRTP
jgi:RNA polymerase sigma-70 factor (ECF subfamily)